MLTNMTTVRKSIERLKWLENIEKQPEFKAMSKKELSALGREREKLLRNLRGIRGMEGKPDAIVIVDSARESIAVAEARRLEIPIVAIVDTNADPAVVNYPDPNNNTTNNTTNTNSHNKTFNLQFFLNESCKDALNITELVNFINMQIINLEATERHDCLAEEDSKKDELYYMRNK